MIFVVCGDELLARGAVSCTGFLLLGAFNSHFCRGGLGEPFVPVDESGESITISSFAVVVIVDCVGLSIGTKADLTTSMCSSSES